MGLQILGNKEFHHFPCNHRTGILVLTGDKVAVAAEVVYQMVADAAARLDGFRPPRAPTPT